MAPLSSRSGQPRTGTAPAPQALPALLRPAPPDAAGIEPDGTEDPWASADDGVLPASVAPPSHPDPSAKEPHMHKPQETPPVEVPPLDPTPAQDPIPHQNPVGRRA